MKLLIPAVLAIILLGIAMALLAFGLKGRRHHGSCGHSSSPRKP